MNASGAGMWDGGRIRRIRDGDVMVMETEMRRDEVFEDLTEVVVASR